MADTTALKNRIRAAIKANNNQEITGSVLQQTLLDIVDELDLNPELENEINARQQADTQLNNLITGIKSNIDNGYVYAGIAMPLTVPVSGKVFYMAMQAGTYANFGELVVTQGINILKYNGSTWLLDAFIGIDDVPTANSGNLIKSGGVHAVTLGALIQDSEMDEVLQDDGEYLIDGIGNVVNDITGNPIATSRLQLTVEELNTLLTGRTGDDKPNTIPEIVDELNDIGDIRSGASKGSTAYQKPITGIPASDIASGVIPTIPTNVSAFNNDANYLTQRDISGKADKVTNATSGNLAGLDANGNLTDSGVAASQVVGSTSVRTIVVLTQAQYDALTTKDVNTEYNIIEQV